jgi:hypothetical protein
VYTLLSTGDVPGASTYFNPLVQQSIIPCTSGTRPTPSHDGMTIWETDTNLHATWDGGAWFYPYSPVYTSVTPTFYSAIITGTAIAGGSVSVTYAKYQKVGTRCHYFGHATINTTVSGANGFGLSLPFASPYRSFSMQSVTMHGSSGDTNYANSVGEAHIPAISAPFNRVGPVNRGNTLIGVVTSGDTVHWNITYETV